MKLARWPSHQVSSAEVLNLEKPYLELQVKRLELVKRSLGRCSHLAETVPTLFLVFTVNLLSLDLFRLFLHFSGHFTLPSVLEKIAGTYLKERWGNARETQRRICTDSCEASSNITSFSYVRSYVQGDTSSPVGSPECAILTFEIRL